MHNSDWRYFYSWMGIVNATPDSFAHSSTRVNELNVQAVRAQLGDWSAQFSNFALNNNLIFNGRSVQNQRPSFYLDIGSESTAPFNAGISLDEEKKRFEQFVNPFFQELRREINKKFNNLQDFLPQWSFDTYKIEMIDFILKKMMEQSSFKKSTYIWNDVSGIIDEKTLSWLKDWPQVNYIFTQNNIKKREDTPFHLQFIDKSEDKDKQWLNLFEEKLFLAYEQLKNIRSEVYLDPGFGFAKTREQNLLLLDHLPCLIGRLPKDIRWVIGISRKSFLRPLEGIRDRSEEIFQLCDLKMGEILKSDRYLKLAQDRKMILRVHQFPQS